MNKDDFLKMSSKNLQEHCFYYKSIELSGMIKNFNESTGYRWITVKPTMENVTTYAQYQMTQPRLKSISLQEQNDLPILYGGGRSFLIRLLENSHSNIIEEADIFILNSYIIIWFNRLDQGLEILYTNVIYHAIRKMDPTQCKDGQSLELILCIKSNYIISEMFLSNASYSSNVFIPSVELVLRPKYANFHRHYNNEMDNLFTFKDFGLNRGDTMLVNCNNSIATCMEFFIYEDSSESDQDQELELSEEYTVCTSMVELLNDANTYSNTGKADDLCDDRMVPSYVQDGSEAGMVLEFYGDNQVAGNKQNLTEPTETQVTKRIKY